MAQKYISPGDNRWQSFMKKPSGAGPQRTPSYSSIDSKVPDYVILDNNHNTWHLNQNIPVNR